MFTIFDFNLQKWLNIIEWVDTFFEKNNACKEIIIYFGFQLFPLFGNIGNQKW
jgi:hypothetical protein